MKNKFIKNAVRALTIAAGALVMFKTQVQAQTTDENPDEVMLGIFFNSEENMTDTLYVSFNGINFYKIGEAYTDSAPEDLDDYVCTDSPSLSPREDRVGEETWKVNCVHDPALIYKDGYFWTMTGYDQEINGEWKFTPMLGYSKDLVNWSFPNSGSETNIKPVNTLPYAADGTRTNTHYDSVAPDIMLDDDGTVWMVVSMGYYAQWHGQDPTLDKESAYLIKVDGLTPGSENPDTRDDKGKAPIVTYSDAVPINLPDDCDNRIDGSLYKEDGKYYLSIKRDGVTCEIWSIDELSLDSVQDSSNWTLVSSQVTYGYEGPCLTKYQDRYYFYTDKLADMGEDNSTGIRVTMSLGIDDAWTEIQPIVATDVNGNTITTRHGTVMTVTDPQAIALIMGRYRAAGYTYDPDVNKPTELSDGWRYKNGKQFFYENGVRSGLEGRGKEVADPVTKEWYWLDSIQDGAVAKDKDVYQESLAGEWGDIIGDDGLKYGKWVHYDSEGRMLKGMQYIQITDKTSEDYGKWFWYYFDPQYGTMAKGYAAITQLNDAGEEETNYYYFDETTGRMQYGEFEVDGIIYRMDVYTGKGWNGWWDPDGDGLDRCWYENGIRQGYDGNNPNYRGKEIYDPDSDAWYWLDNNNKGLMAAGKDVYQESYAGEWGDIIGEDGLKYGKWVRYDDWGHMVKGWNWDGTNSWYFDKITGTMVKGTATIDGVTYTFASDTGILVQ
jgi:hypothetical protein